jgi:hypothetical protein
MVFSSDIGEIDGGLRKRHAKLFHYISDNLRRSQETSGLYKLAAPSTLAEIRAEAFERAAKPISSTRRKIHAQQTEAGTANGIRRHVAGALERKHRQVAGLGPSQLFSVRIAAFMPVASENYFRSTRRQQRIRA